MFACHPFIDHIQASLSHALLPPANEVWGKVIFLHLSVILFTGGVSGPEGGGCLVPGVGGVWSRGWGGVSGPGATATGGTHPTGMHSCSVHSFS